MKHFLPSSIFAIRAVAPRRGAWIETADAAKHPEIR